LETTIKVIWRQTQNYIMAYIFFPYMVYFIVFIVYISFIFEPEEERKVVDWVLQVPCLIFSIVQLILESFQIKREGFSK